MSFLADTHTALWYFEGDPALSDTARELLETTIEPVYLSIASVWEISIKVGLRKLRLRAAPHRVLEGMLEAGFELLPITANQALQSGHLPFHHRDPFDRMLIAQAQDRGLTLISRDEALREYDVMVLW